RDIKPCLKCQARFVRGILTSEKRDDSSWQLLRRYGNLGVEMVVAVLIGVAGGYQLDQWLGVQPLFLILGFIFGAAAGFLNFFRLITSEKDKTQLKKRIEQKAHKKDEKN
ncbi:MAG: AtpZ/AtpI family protein, partial [Nitrospiria bacterium]